MRNLLQALITMCDSHSMQPGGPHPHYAISAAWILEILPVWCAGQRADEGCSAALPGDMLPSQPPPRGSQQRPFSMRPGHG